MSWAWPDAMARTTKPLGAESPLTGGNLSRLARSGARPEDTAALDDARPLP
jgi:hypothetical protein